MGWTPGGVARNFLNIRLFDSLFLADTCSGGEEQDDGLLDQSKASTVYLSRSKWLSVIALTGKDVFLRTVNGYKP